MMLTTNSESIYRLWLDRIVQAHRTRSWEQHATKESDEEDEWFQAQWEKLDDVRRNRLWGLSADLHSLRDQDTYVSEDWPPMSVDDLRRRQSDAYLSKDWDRLLESLRRPPRFRPQEDLDYARGRAWMELGHPDVAVLFFDNAARINPQNLAFPALALECLREIPDWNAALIRAEAYRERRETHPRLLFRAGEIFHLSANALGLAANYEKAIEVVNRGLAMLDDGSAREPVKSVIASAYATKALSLEHLDRHAEALGVLNDAVSRFHENSLLFVARGLLKQQLGDPSARDDFKRAIDAGAAVVWPYLELAREALRQADYSSVLEMCRRGLQCRPGETTAALLQQFIAIALFELGHSRDSVQSAFDAVTELDPLNADAQVNRRIFDEAMKAGAASARPWQIPTASPLTAFNELRSQLSSAAA